MKKSLKKLLSAALVLLMLMPLMGIQTLAAPSLKLPSVTDVQILTDEKISLKELGEYYESIREMFNEAKESFYEDYDITFEEFIDVTGGMLSYNLPFDDLKYKVTLSNGKAMEIDSSGYGEYNSIVNVFISSVVTYGEYKDALDKGKNTVKVKLTATVSNAFDSYGFTDKVEHFDREIEVVDCYVKSLKAISGLPKQSYLDDDYLLLEGAEFEIVYDDGTKKTAKVKNIPNELYGGIEHTLDGKPFNYTYNEDLDGVIYVFMDATCTAPIEVKEGDPFKSITITDYVFDEGQELTQVSYDIIWDNGTKKSYTSDVSFNSEILSIYAIVECVDGFYVYAEKGAPLDVENPEAGYEYFTLSVGEVEDYFKVELEGSGILARLVALIKSIIAKLLSIFGI